MRAPMPETPVHENRYLPTGISDIWSSRGLFPIDTISWKTALPQQFPNLEFRRSAFAFIGFHHSNRGIRCWRRITKARHFNRSEVSNQYSYGEIRPPRFGSIEYLRTHGDQCEFRSLHVQICYHLGSIILVKYPDMILYNGDL